MGVSDDSDRPSAREIFDETLAGARPQPFLPRLRSDPSPYEPIPHSLREFRAQEGTETRRTRLRALWAALPETYESHGAPSEQQPSHAHNHRSEGAGADEATTHAYPVRRDGDLTAEGARRLDAMYADELLQRCTGGHGRGSFARRVSWPEFERYADKKEAGEFSVFCSAWSAAAKSCTEHEEAERRVVGFGRTVADFPRRAGLGRERTPGAARAGGCVAESRCVSRCA